METQDLREVANCIRLIMQKQSLTWQMQKGHCNNDLEMFNSFNNNQVLQLCSLYLLTLINKHMEIQEISQVRQKTQNLRQMQAYRGEVEHRFEELQQIYHMQQDRYEKKIAELQKELADARKESASRLVICQEKENDLKILLGGGGDVRELREMFERI